MTMNELVNGVVDYINRKDGTQDNISTYEEILERLNNLDCFTPIDNVGGFLCGEATMTTYKNDDITHINAVFKGNPYLEEIDLPNVITGSSQCFADCTSLKRANLPNLEITQGQSSGSLFNGCKSLTSVNCSKLKSDDDNMSTTYMTFYICSSLVDVTPFVNIESLSWATFYKCSLLEKIDFHSLKHISSYGGGGQQFDGCTSLTALIIRTPTLCTLASTNCFNNTPITNGTGYIYVPKLLIEDYKVATNWTVYANQFRAIEDYPEICEVTE